MLSGVINKRAGIAGGMFMSILPNLAIEDVVRTLVLGAVGTIASYCLTLVLQWLTRIINGFFESRNRGH